MTSRRLLLAALALAAAACFDEPSDGAARRPPTGFSGVSWTVKVNEDGTAGPGPNWFSGSEENLWVDARGWLHLRITYRDGAWRCAELVSNPQYGYGTYVFTLAPLEEALDPNAVLGLFTWDDALDPGEVNAWREIDLELSRWGDPDNDDFQFVVQPWDLAPANLYRFDLGDATAGDTVHAFTWSAEGVAFTSARGDTWPPAAADVLATYTYTGPATPTPRNAQVRLNLWLMWGRPPMDGQAQEVVVKRFEFRP